MSQPILEINGLRKHYGQTRAVGDFSLDVEQGEFVTLLGPSGCGKTTTLRMIMGFIRADSGKITLNGTPLVDSDRGIFVPPESRNTAMVFQSYAVWPHMTVFENVAYPNRVKKHSRAETNERTERALKLVNLWEYAKRRPHELSGGQQQRVALARALAMRANLLLLDEPLSNLDAKLREMMRFEIRELQRETKSTTIYVTHDQTEAMAMSDRIVVMSQGEIEQIGSPEQVYSRPVNRFVASFIGTANFLSCRVSKESGDRATVSLPGGYETEALKRSELKAGGKKGLLMARPEDFELVRSDPTVPGIPARVIRRTYLGDSLDYLVEADETKVRIRTNERRLPFADGDNVSLRFLRLPFLLEVEEA
ncbi:MAG TPA: ABC transporter ATP-binding protein [Spirochaetia bacterium]|nr:ABC transporter ATP-binding protein [Spirochaetia bacterium]